MKSMSVLSNDHIDPSVLEAEFHSAGFSVAIHSFAPSGEDLVALHSDHMLACWLSPKPANMYSGPADSPRLLRRTGDLAFIPASFATTSRYQPGTPLHHVAIFRFCNDVIASELIPVFGQEPEKLFSANVENHGIRQAMRLLAEEITEPGLAYHLMVESMCLGIIIRLARTFGAIDTQGSGNGGLAPWQLRRIRDRIQSCTNGSFPTIAELATLTAISPRHLTRAFKQSTGRTIGAYVAQLRLDYAQTLLAESGLPLSIIASRLGFESVRSFATGYRRATAETPSQFRRRVRGQLEH